MHFVTWAGVEDEDGACICCERQECICDALDDALMEREPTPGELEAVERRTHE